MWFIACLLLVALSSPGTVGQALRQKQGSKGQEFHFQTRGKDSCTMRTSGLGEARLRVECHHQDGVYWCEFRGQPGVCPAFTANPRPYWAQALQELRRLRHACQGAPTLRPSLCLKAGPQAHMRQMASSLQGSPAPRQLPETAGRPPPPPTTPAQPRKVSQLPSQPVVKATQPGHRPGGEEAEKVARELFWECLQAIYTSIVSFFRG